MHLPCREAWKKNTISVGFGLSLGRNGDVPVQFITTSGEGTPFRRCFNFRLANPFKMAATNMIFGFLNL